MNFDKVDDPNRSRPGAKNVGPQMPMSAQSRPRYCVAAESTRSSFRPPDGAARSRCAPTVRSIELGDLVRLKSGGPCMVVVGATRADVTAQWFAEGAMLRGTFLRIALVPADGPDDW